MTDDPTTRRLDAIDRDLAQLAHAVELTAGAGINIAATQQTLSDNSTHIVDLLRQLETRTEAARLAVGALSDGLAELAARITTMEEDARRGRQV